MEKLSKDEKTEIAVFFSVIGVVAIIVGLIFTYIYYYGCYSELRKSKTFTVVGIVKDTLYHPDYKVDDSYMSFNLQTSTYDVRYSHKYFSPIHSIFVESYGNVNSIRIDVERYKKGNTQQEMYSNNLAHGKMKYLVTYNKLAKKCETLKKNDKVIIYYQKVYDVTFKNSSKKEVRRSFEYAKICDVRKM